MVDSKASAVWQGDLFSGSGRAKLDSSSAGEFDVNWKARAESGGGGGTTTPEELLAAAHAACFSMAFSNGLAQNGTPPERLDVSAVVSFVPGTGVTKSALTVVGRVSGLDAGKFQELAEDAKANCPVSKALAGVDIVLESVSLDS
ncbi:OsmC family peroxiredoxin [Naasia sp. SYSU D00057]|uniref:OsmC family peroxiredoxin n=1 Tax=Naasia sp. SYSU D00057 TaxID=2817380 RepID=UPI001B304C04|nr:OsmC family peroxiredoxin [Naasia sp. SYSU D00057]